MLSVAAPQPTEQDLVDMHRLFRRDPEAFVRVVIGADPSEQQGHALRAIAIPGAHVSITSGHGTGKSACLAWLILWHVVCLADSKCGATAPTAPQLSAVLWAEVAKWHQRMHPWYRNQISVTSDMVCVKGAEKTQFAVARTARKEAPEALQGLHASHMLFLADEASGVPDAIFEAAEGSLSTPGARVVLASNPTRNSGYFHRSHHKDRAFWTCLRFSCLDSPHVSPEYGQQMAAKYGEDSDLYRVRVLGQFPRASSLQLISTEVVEAAAGRSRHQSEYLHAPVILGCDVARFGDDQTVIYRRQGLVSWHMGAWRGLDTMATASRVAQMIQEGRPDAVFVDGGGLGAGVVDRLRQLGHGITDVNFGSKAGKDHLYVNKRAEMWAKMRDWLKSGGCIPDDPEICDDLTSLEYGFDAKERIQLESKDDMKRRGLSSPDKADALALTFAEPVIGSSDREQRQRHMAQAITRYNPLDGIPNRDTGSGAWGR